MQHPRRGASGGRWQQRSRQQRTPQKVRAASDILRELQARVALAPTRRIPLAGPNAPLTLRLLDLLCPIGFGQRALILAPPKTGKTTFLKDICNGVSAGAPNAKLYCLLVDERPEEVTDFRRSVKAEVFASSNDRSLEEHLEAANVCLERIVADTLAGHDVVIVVDSLTRLSRAHNLNTRTGRTMSGGIDAQALEMPKRFFGTARQVEDGGSLTIVATALIDTGSLMDDVIAQEFKGTGNMELVLDRRLADRRIFPALDIAKSGTRKEDQLLTPAELKASHVMRRRIADLTPVEGTKLIISLFEKVPSNDVLIKELAAD